MLENLLKYSIYVYRESSSEIISFKHLTLGTQEAFEDVNLLVHSVYNTFSCWLRATHTRQSQKSTLLLCFVTTIRQLSASMQIDFHTLCLGYYATPTKWN